MFLPWFRKRMSGLYQRTDADITSFTDRFSAMDLNTDDPERFRKAYPLVAAAEPFSVFLRPGDVLFVPRDELNKIRSSRKTDSQ